MSKLLRTQRWLEWEVQCLERAFKQNIQLKVIADALGKSVNAIRKHINRLGLRGDQPPLGRPQKNPHFFTDQELIPTDLEKMTEILLSHGPAAKKEAQTPPKKNEIVGYIEQKEAAYSLVSPLDYTLVKEGDFAPLGVPRVAGEPLYISLSYVEEWALSKGFRPVTGALLAQGISYWRDGKYFSKAQVLVHVNKIRLQNKLQPLVMCEEERGA
jgi:hypothetical protein